MVSFGNISYCLIPGSGIHAKAPLPTVNHDLAPSDITHRLLPRCTVTAINSDLRIYNSEPCRFLPCFWDRNGPNAVFENLVSKRGGTLIGVRGFESEKKATNSF